MTGYTGSRVPIPETQLSSIQIKLQSVLNFDIKNLILIQNKIEINKTHKFNSFKIPKKYKQTFRLTTG